VPGTRAALRALAAAARIPKGTAERLLENYAFLRRLETALRLDSNRAVSSLPPDPAGCHALARWLGFSGTGPFMDEHMRRLGETRQIFDNLPSHLELAPFP